MLEKTIYDKARDKMKQGKKDDEAEQLGEKEKDYLQPILKKLGFSGKDLNEEAAIMVKNEALRNLKERLLTRAEIIQRRLEEEQKNLEQAYVRTFRYVNWRLFRQTSRERARIRRRRTRRRTRARSRGPTLG